MSAAVLDVRQFEETIGLVEGPHQNYMSKVTEGYYRYSRFHWSVSMEESFFKVSLWLNSLRKPRPPSVGFEDECLPVRLYGGEYWGHSKELTHKTPYECTRLIVMMSYFEAVFPKYIHYSQLGEKLCYVVLAFSSFGIGPEPRPRDQIDSWTSSQAGEIRKRCAYYRVRKCRTHQSGEHEAAPWVPHMFWRNAGTSIQHN